MADRESEHDYYYPSGVPLTPQARNFGYEFPVYVSDVVWVTCCAASGLPSRLDTSLEKRIWELLQHCYEGMTKKLTQEDDFVFYTFKVWFWSRNRPRAKKKQKMRLGARLFLNPSTKGPWMYIFAPNVDHIDMLKRGEAPAAEPYDPMVHFDPAPGECE